SSHLLGKLRQPLHRPTAITKCTAQVEKITVSRTNKYGHTLALIASEFVSRTCKLSPSVASRASTTTPSETAVSAFTTNNGCSSKSPSSSSAASTVVKLEITGVSTAVLASTLRPRLEMFKIGSCSPV